MKTMFCVRVRVLITWARSIWKSHSTLHTKISGSKCSPFLSLRRHLREPCGVLSTVPALWKFPAAYHTCTTFLLLIKMRKLWCGEIENQELWPCMPMNKSLSLPFLSYIWILRLSDPWFSLGQTVMAAIFLFWSKAAFLTLRISN